VANVPGQNDPKKKILVPEDAGANSDSDQVFSDSSDDDDAVQIRNNLSSSYPRRS